MQDLPLELLIDGIWPNLSLFDIFRRARYTCKLWNNNIEHSIKSLDLTDSWQLPPGRYVEMRSGEWRKSKFLTHIDPKRITGHLKVSAIAYAGAKPFLEELLSHFQYVTKLHVMISYGEGGLWEADHAIARLKHLQELGVWCNSWPFNDELTKILVPKLVWLRLEYDSTDLLLKFAPAMTNLRHMHVGAISEGYVATHLSYLTKLRSLDDSDVETLPPRLASLSFVTPESGELPNLEGSAKTLQHLSIRNLKRVNRLQFPVALKLVSLDLTWCHQDILKDLAPSLVSLRSFTFRYSSDFSLESSNLKFVSSVTTLILHAPTNPDTSILSHFPHLRHLELHSEETGAAEIPEALWPTARNCPNLRTLALEMYATPSRLIEGLRGLSSLERIYFLCLAHEPITNEAWTALASLKSLTWLRIAAQSKTKAVSKSEDDVLYLCEQLDQLNQLMLEEVVAIEDAEVLKQLRDRLHKKHPALDFCHLRTTPMNYVEPDW